MCLKWFNKFRGSISKPVKLPKTEKQKFIFNLTPEQRKICYPGSHVPKPSPEPE